MNGIEALQALKDGKIVRYVRQNTHSSKDTLYIFHEKCKGDTTRILWSKFVDEWAWSECTNNTRFWLMTDGFEVVDPGEVYA